MLEERDRERQWAASARSGGYENEAMFNSSELIFFLRADGGRRGYDATASVLRSDAGVTVFYELHCWSFYSNI